MDLGVLLAALTQADAGSREVNPFAPLQDASQGIGNILLQNAQNFSPTENAWGGLAAGLLSGVTGNLVNNFQDKQNQTAQDLIFKIAAGQDVGERPSNISPSVFSKLGNTVNILKLQEGMDQQKIAAQSQSELTNSIAKAAIEKTISGNPYEQKKAQAILDRIGVKGASEPVTETPGEQSAALDPYSAALDKYQGSQPLAEAEVKRGIEAPDRLKALRQEFEALPEVKLFVQSNIGYNSLKKAIQDPAGTSDYEIIRGVAQAVEPGSVTRDGEAAALANTSSVPDSYKSAISAALTGGSKLPPDVRAGLLRIAERRYNEYATNFNKVKGFYQKQAEGAQLDPTGITYLDDAKVGNSAGGVNTEYLQKLAKIYPNTPEGKAAFRLAVQNMQGQNGR